MAWTAEQADLHNTRQRQSISVHVQYQPASPLTCPSKHQQLEPRIEHSRAAVSQPTSSNGLQSSPLVGLESSATSHGNSYSPTSSSGVSPGAVQPGQATHTASVHSNGPNAPEQYLQNLSSPQVGPTCGTQTMTQLTRVLGTLELNGEQVTHLFQWLVFPVAQVLQ